MEGVLCAAGRTCRHAIEAVQDKELLLQRDWARSRLVDFNHWAAGVGLFARSNNALDYRLRDHPDAIEVLHSLLSTVTAVFQRCLRQCDESSQARSGKASVLQRVPESAEESGSPTLSITPWSSDEESDTPAEDRVEEATPDLLPSMLGGTCKDAENLMDRLVDIGVLIRRSGLSVRLLRADQSFKEEPYIHLRRHLEHSLYLRQLLASSTPEERQQKDPSALPVPHAADHAYLRESQIHLVRANLRRRHRFAFARKRAMTLAKEVVTTAIPIRAMEITQERKVSPSVEPDTLPPEESVAIASQVSASAVQQGFDIKALEVRSGSSVANSAQLSTTGSKLTYPKPPQISKEQAFKCPCCYQIQPKRVGANRGRWRKHIARDLYPYTCPVVGCAYENTLFAKQKEWRSHLSEHHRVVSHWTCSICVDNQHYSNRDAFEEHIRVRHIALIDHHYLPAFMRMSQREIVDLPSLCPVCSLALAPVDTEEVMNHLAACIHSFSLLALPWNDGPAQGPSIPKSERSERIQRWLADLTDEGSMQPPEAMQIRYASHAPNTISATASAPSLPDDHYFDPSIGSSGIPSTRSMDHEQTAASASGDWSSRRVSDHQLEMSAIASGNFWSGYVDDPWWPCILALDGGGIRGYSSLLILKALMHDVWLWEQKLQDEKSHRESVVSAPSARLPVDEDALLPCHYFDFMFGTSSGGIIATLLGRLRLTVNESLAIYRRLGEDMFGRRRSRLPLATKYYHEPLEEAIKDAVRSRYDKHTFREGIDDLFPLDADHLEEMLQRPVPFDVDDPRVCHSCCVTATHAEETESAQAHLLRTYPHYYSENTSNWITRYNEGADKLPIWKVVRATSATPFYFEMVTHEVDGVKKTFKDGGIRENNPSFAAYSEFRALYESRAGEPALLLSVGAGRYDPAPALGLFGRLPFLSTYLETQRIIQNLTVKYAEGEGQHRFLRGRAGGENFWYKRMDVAGMEKMQQDEWVKGKYMGRKSVPGGATLTAIEEATKRDLQRRFDGRFDSYASPPMVRDQTAEKLVRQRRARERLGGPRWAKFVGLADNLIAK